MVVAEVKKIIAELSENDRSGAEKFVDAGYKIRVTLVDLEKKQVQIDAYSPVDKNGRATRMNAFGALGFDGGEPYDLRSDVINTINKMWLCVHHAESGRTKAEAC